MTTQGILLDERECPLREDCVHCKTCRGFGIAPSDLSRVRFRKIAPRAPRCRRCNGSGCSAHPTGAAPGAAANGERT